jgi:hypothetical protein
LFGVGLAFGRQVVEIDICELNDIHSFRDLQPISTKNGTGIQRERQHEKPDYGSFFLTRFYHALFSVSLRVPGETVAGDKQQ